MVKAKRSTKSENISASYNKFKEFEGTGMKEGVTNGITMKVSGKKRSLSCGKFLTQLQAQGRAETG